MQKTSTRFPALFALVAATLGLMTALPAHAQKATAKTGKGSRGSAAASAGYVRWTEPTEGSFSLEIPKGWKATGGLKRVANSDVRQGIFAISPSDDAMVMLGDISLPQFSTIGQFKQQRGVQEGSSENINGNFAVVYMHYMSALEFNRAYLQKGWATGLDNFQITQEKDVPEAAQKMQAQLQNQSHNPQARVSLAVTTFSGVDKKTGKKIAGGIITKTTLVGTENAQYGSIWTAYPVIMGGWDDEQSDSRTKAILAAGIHMQQTWRGNPTWEKKEIARQARLTREALERNKQEIAAAQRRAASGGGGGGATGGSGGGSSDLMASYWRRNALNSQLQRQRVLTIRGNKDVVGTDGNIYEVPDR